MNNPTRTTVQIPGYKTPTSVLITHTTDGEKPYTCEHTYGNVGGNEPEAVERAFGRGETPEEAKRDFVSSAVSNLRTS